VELSPPAPCSILKLPSRSSISFPIKPSLAKPLPLLLKLLLLLLLLLLLILVLLPPSPLLTISIALEDPTSSAAPAKPQRRLAALSACSYLPRLMSHRGDSGAKSIPPPNMTAGAAARVNMTRQSAEGMITLIRSAAKMPRQMDSWFKAPRVPRYRVGAIWIRVEEGNRLVG